MSSKAAPSLTISEQIISLYANFSALENLDIFGRFDMFDPDTDFSNDAANYFIGGFNYEPTKGLSIAPNIRYTDYQANGVDSDVEFKLNFQFKI
jgi:hypothetical protein